MGLRIASSWFAVPLVATMSSRFVVSSFSRPLGSGVTRAIHRTGSTFHSPTMFGPISPQHCRPPLFLRKTSVTRLLGTKMGPGKPAGDIAIYDEQNVLKLDMDRLRTTIDAIRRCIRYDTYDVTLILVDDKEMKSMNLESRGVNAPTDILSFPFHGAVSPGVLEDVEFDIPDYYMLVSI